MSELNNTWWRCRRIATRVRYELSKLSPPELHELAQWLKHCGIRTVALESTGIYWIALYEVLEQHGFEVRVVNARHVKHVPGRSKTDVLDCQWIQKLHSFGLLNGSFRPDQQIRKLRTYQRLQDNLVVNSAQAIHHLQKALFEMNVQLSNVISDVSGESGLRILEAIIAGERDPEQLAALCSSRIKASRQTVAKSLHGNWDPALLHCLKSALDTYRFTQRQIQECDLLHPAATDRIGFARSNTRLGYKPQSPITPSLRSRSNQNSRY